jgi:hypothetical protein
VGNVSVSCSSLGCVFSVAFCDSVAFDFATFAKLPFWKFGKMEISIPACFAK